MTKSEAFVVKLCKKAFLTLWTMANPVGKEPGKELCDALIVFGNDIIIISVKDIIYKPTEDETTGWDRWTKKAIEKSIKQLEGAKRYIDSVSEIESKEHGIHFKLPTCNEKRFYHLITISLGAGRNVPVSIPMENEVVHFIDEFSLDTIFNELDTVTDFIEYLDKKEFLFESQRKIIIGSEENLMACYIYNNRSFPKNSDFMILDDNLWSHIKNCPDYIQKKEFDRISYFWDEIIEEFINKRDPAIQNISGAFDTSNENTELALRVLAKESRFSRRVLAQTYSDFLQNKELESRAMQSPQSDVCYVFLKKPKDFDRSQRQKELLARCIVIRDRIGKDSIIIGLATEIDIRKGHSFDLLYFQKNIWTEEDKKNAKYGSDKLGLFKHLRLSTLHADEYPQN